MTTITTARLECPNCGAAVEANVLTSTNFHGMTTDLRRLTWGADLLEYMVHTCRECGFTGSEAGFAEMVERDVSDLIAEHIRPNIRHGGPQSDTRWEFCALIAEWRGKDPLAIAKLYQNAAWCAKAQDREQRLRRRVVAWLELALEAGTPNRPVVLYLIGEQYRRCGEKSVADAWFDAVTEADHDPDAAQLKKLALQQKIAPRDLMS